MKAADRAATAAEGIRGLNHALYDGITYPGDAYSIVGYLSHLASMLPQALDVTRRAVEQLEQDAGLRSDRGTLPDDLVGTYEGLVQASADAQALYTSVARAHAALSHIALQDGAQ